MASTEHLDQFSEVDMPDLPGHKISCQDMNDWFKMRVEKPEDGEVDDSSEHPPTPVFTIDARSDLTHEESDWSAYKNYNLRSGPREIQRCFESIGMDVDQSGDFDPRTANRKSRPTCKRLRSTNWHDSGRNWNKRDSMVDDMVNDGSYELIVKIRFVSAKGHTNFRQKVVELNQQVALAHHLDHSQRYSLRQRRPDAAPNSVSEVNENVEERSNEPVLPGNLAGHPDARGCHSCLALKLRCPLLDNELLWPCIFCEDEGCDCIMITEALVKQSCKPCRRKRIGCSYTRSPDHYGPCQQCTTDCSLCFAAPAIDPRNVRIRYDRDWVKHPMPTGKAIRAALTATSESHSEATDVDSTLALVTTHTNVPSAIKLNSIEDHQDQQPKESTLRCRSPFTLGPPFDSRLQSKEPQQADSDARCSSSLPSDPPIEFSENLEEEEQRAKSNLPTQSSRVLPLQHVEDVQGSESGERSFSPFSILSLGSSESGEKQDIGSDIHSPSPSSGENRVYSRSKLHIQNPPQLSSKALPDQRPVMSMIAERKASYKNVKTGKLTSKVVPNNTSMENGRTPRFPEKTITIMTKFCHPILFNHTDTIEGRRPCNFCFEPGYAIFGLGAKTVEVIKVPGRPEYQEVTGGHRAAGVQNTRMCPTCVVERLPIISCRQHKIQRIPNVHNSSLELERAIQDLVNKKRSALCELCSICPSLAEHKCCATTKSTKGCGLLLCNACKTELVHDYKNDLQMMLRSLVDEPTLDRPLGLRADYGLLKDQGLLLQYVLWNCNRS